MRLRKIIIATAGIAFVAVAILSIAPFQAAARRLINPEWRATSPQQTSTVDGLTFTKLSLRRGSQSAECSFARFNATDFELVVLDNGPDRASPRFRDLADAMTKFRCAAGTNGGFFEIESFAPNGLMIANGIRTGAFAPDAWSEGVLAVRNSRPTLEHQGDFLLDDAVTQLVQTGPWLARDGIAKTGFRHDTPAPRTFIATDGNQNWVLGTFASTTLEDLAVMICSQPFRAVLNVRDALNLDGGPSSAFWVRVTPNETVSSRENTVVRNFIGIRRR